MVKGRIEDLVKGGPCTQWPDLKFENVDIPPTPQTEDFVPVGPRRYFVGLLMQVVPFVVTGHPARWSLAAGFIIGSCSRGDLCSMSRAPKKSTKARFPSSGTVSGMFQPQNNCVESWMLICKDSPSHS